MHNVISSAAVAEIVRESGARPVRTRVGHSFIKSEMARNGAVFGGEHSAHYYFRDFWFADTGMLAALHVLAALGEQDRPLSQVCDRFERYVASGEINSTVTDQQAALEQIEAWANVRGARTDEATDSPSRVPRAPTRCGGSTCAPPTPNPAAAQRRGCRP